VTEGILAVVYVSIMGVTRFYKTTVFLHLNACKFSILGRIGVAVLRTYWCGLLLPTD